MIFFLWITPGSMSGTFPLMGRTFPVKLVYSFGYLQKVLLLSSRIMDISSWFRTVYLDFFQRVTWPYRSIFGLLMISFAIW